MGRPLELALLFVALAAVAARELWLDATAMIAGQLTGTPGVSSTLVEVCILLVICVAHLALEKPNWQMFGVYAVSIVSVALSAVWFINPDSWILTGPHPWVKIIVRFIAGLLILTSAIVRVFLPLPKLPKLPKHRVGTREIFVNFSQMESSDPLAKAIREELNQRGVKAQESMRVRLWFPTDAHTGHIAPYVGRSLLEKMMSVFMDIEGKALERVMVIASHILLAKSNSWLNVDISAAKPRWPLLVMSHGLKASPEIYSTYAEYFASMGYIVAAPAHTDGSCPENWKGQGPGKWSWEYSNAQLRQRVQDIKFMTNYLASEASKVSSRIDWENCLVCGHSFGGATTTGVLKYDDRFHTGVCWDTWMWSLSPEDKSKPMNKQILYINSEWFLVGEGREVNLESVNQVCRSNRSGGHITLLKDTAHHNYNDLPLLVHPSLQKLMRSSNGPPKMFGKLSPHRALEITMDASAAFFDFSIKQGTKSTNQVSNVSTLLSYPELEYEFVAPQN